MSAAHIEQMFLAPRDFLKMNLVYMIGTLPAVQGVFHFSYEPAPGTHCLPRIGLLARERYPARVWHLRLVPRSARHSVVAYFLPCSPGRLVRGVLPKDGQFMLAAGLPGSTFGAARYLHGAVEVCHASYRDAGGAPDFGRTARETAWCSARLHGQAHARQGWQFHAQRWERQNAVLFNYCDLITL